MSRRLIVPLLALLCLLSGCSAWRNDDYLSLSPHSTATTQTASPDAVTVENYLGLKNAILGFIREGQANGTIRVTNYDGDVESDLSEAAYEVSKLDPLGAYAVDYMTHDLVRIVSYYEIHISITFRRTAEEIAAIEPVSTEAQLQSKLHEAIDRCDRRLTVRMSNYQAPDIQAMVDAYCAENPGTVIEKPTLTVSAYPDTGTVRVLEIDFGYTETPQALSEKAEAVGESVDAAAEYIRYRDSDRGKAELLFTYLMERFTYEAGESTTPLYDALCSGVATPLGLSQAWQLICDQAGVECYTVSGLKDGESYTWNIISADGYFRHVDLCRCVLERGTLVLESDGEMSGYYWDQEEYPACEPEAIVPVTPELPEAPAETPPSEEPEPEEPQPEEPTEPPAETPDESQPHSDADGAQAAV